MIEKTDRRFKRTRKLLMDALITLAQRDGYDAVTIRDIATEADIAYSTFFRHYDDKDELLTSIIQNAMAELRGLMQNHSSEAERGTLIFQHVAQNEALYRTLLGGLNSSAMVQKAQQVIVTEILANRPPAESEGEIPAEIVANHIAVSVLALVKWWLDNQMPYSPERMGAVYNRLIMDPIKHLAENR